MIRTDLIVNLKTMEYLQLRKIINDYTKKTKEVEELISRLYAQLDRGEIPLDTASVKLYNYFSRISKIVHDKEQELGV